MRFSLRQPRCSWYVESYVEVNDFLRPLYQGNNSDLFEFPWAVQLGYEKAGDLEYNCGGSVISGLNFYRVVFSNIN